MGMASFLDFMQANIRGMCPIGGTCHTTLLAINTEAIPINNDDTPDQLRLAAL